MCTRAQDAPTRAIPNNNPRAAAHTHLCSQAVSDSACSNELLRRLSLHGGMPALQLAIRSPHVAQARSQHTWRIAPSSTHNVLKCELSGLAVWHLGENVVKRPRFHIVVFRRVSVVERSATFAPNVSVATVHVLVVGGRRLGSAGTTTKRLEEQPGDPLTNTCGESLRRLATTSSVARVTSAWQAATRPDTHTRGTKPAVIHSPLMQCQAPAPTHGSPPTATTQRRQPPTLDGSWSTTAAPCAARHPPRWSRSLPRAASALGSPAPGSRSAAAGCGRTRRTTRPREWGRPRSRWMLRGTLSRALPRCCPDRQHHTENITTTALAREGLYALGGGGQGGGTVGSSLDVQGNSLLTGNGTHCHVNKAQGLQVQGKAR